ncbi:TetR/AcrR family transcriptional regulator [Kitasatospora sp. NBC_01287]|uniref:TetR/AcrR family transcriptional regulator n=1 Tax=Kitasatospora sp. NBC_01287 TaxID=2903573 RepID=UPI00225A1E0F|nr:TetR/AcrR family transcriptional regulator C-terminal domain-containing protein [Kitasatospora sp. NBC_01287]MCX4748058.1 TetR/AcrR family transcriptional regulator [Kitasatospora sp. NBC_01287]
MGPAESAESAGTAGTARPAETPEAADSTYQLLWGSRPQSRRGPKPALTLERIAAAAIEVADAEGMAAVSMQRVAGALGKTKMSLYRYLPGKAELVAVMTDIAMGEPPAPVAPPGDWTAGLTHWARQLSAALARHPWLLETTVGPRLLGPNELGWLEAALLSLDGTPLRGAERTDAVLVVAGHIRGIALQARATAPGELTETQLAAGMARVVRSHGERYPAVSTALLDAAANGGQDQGLDFGLRCILEGLRTLIEQAR